MINNEMLDMFYLDYKILEVIKFVRNLNFLKIFFIIQT